jgi:hypothetical protein
VAREPHRHRHHRVDHGLHLRGAFRSAAVPVERQAERVLHGRGARPREAPGVAHDTAGVRGQAVDVGEGEPGVGDRGERRFDREVELAAAEPPPDRRLPDARDDRPPFWLGGYYLLMATDSTVLAKASRILSAGTSAVSLPISTPWREKLILIGISIVITSFHLVTLCTKLAGQSDHGNPRPGLDPEYAAAPSIVPARVS